MTRTGDFWLDRSQDSTEIDDMILAIWFPTFNDAEKWIISERKFKTPSFPESYGSDVMILPLNDIQPQGVFQTVYMMNNNKVYNNNVNLQLTENTNRRVRRQL